MPQNVYIYDPDVRVPDDVQHVIIPEGITVIKEDTFRNYRNLQTITIPDSVTEIRAFAFDGCSGLQSVVIPDSVAEIAPATFYRCAGLRSITIPDSVTVIGGSAFSGCSGLRSVTIPDSVTEIGEFAFYGCSALQSVTIPDSVTEINGNAFSGCSGLRSVTIPDSVTEIGDYAFNDCSALQSITIPDSVTEIGESAFWGCAGLQSITIPDSVTEISGGTFCDCFGLQSVTIPDSVTKIGFGVFEGCSGLQSITIPDSVTYISDYVFKDCSGLQSVTIPDGVTEIGFCAFKNCSALQALLYKGVNIAPFINIDGYGVNAFSVIKALIEHQIPLSENTVKFGIDMAHRSELSRWVPEYPVFGTMHLSPLLKSVDVETEEHLRQCFLTQKRTRGHVPEILKELTMTACICQIPPERLAGAFDIGYTRILLDKEIPLVPATACRCYYDRGICDMLIRKDRISIAAEAIGLYNRFGHQECYKHLIDFILSHPDTKIEDLQYAVDHAKEIPMKAGTTLAQVRRHRTYTENLAEITKIEAKYGRIVPGFRLSDYQCSISPVGITYNGMTARVLDLSDDGDIALAAGLGKLTGCCQRLYAAGETAMMHGFLNPDAGFWVIEDKDGKIKAQAEIWKSDGNTLVFDNIEFADTDRDHLSEKAEHLRNVIAVWATESGYTNIIMGCGYNELGTASMEQAPIPELRLTPEEVFALQKGNNTGISFRNIEEARQYMRTGQYRPGDFVYTDTDDRCVYIKKEGIVSDYLIQGYNRCPADKRNEPVCGQGMRISRDMR